MHPRTNGAVYLILISPSKSNPIRSYSSLHESLLLLSVHDFSSTLGAAHRWIGVTCTMMTLGMGQKRGGGNYDLVGFDDDPRMRPAHNGPAPRTIYWILHVRSTENFSPENTLSLSVAGLLSAQAPYIIIAQLCSTYCGCASTSPTAPHGVNSQPLTESV